MLIYWVDFSAHLLRIKEDAEWYLYADLNDCELPTIYLIE